MNSSLCTVLQNVVPPPHRRHLARSFPVPRGRTATGGLSTRPNLSIASISQPTVPSPPQTKIRAPGTSLKNCNLWAKNPFDFCKHSYLCPIILTLNGLHILTVYLSDLLQFLKMNLSINFM